MMTPTLGDLWWDLHWTVRQILWGGFDLYRPKWPMTILWSTEYICSIVGTDAGFPSLHYGVLHKGHGNILWSRIRKGPVWLIFRACYRIHLFHLAYEERLLDGGIDWCESVFVSDDILGPGRRGGMTGLSIWFAGASKPCLGPFYCSNSTEKKKDK